MTSVSDVRIRLKPGALHAFCKAQDISRNEAARRIGVSIATAYRIDEGMVDPSPRFIGGFMAATGMKFEALFEVVAEDAA